MITITKHPNIDNKKKGRRVMDMTAIKRSDTINKDIVKAGKEHKDKVCFILRNGDDDILISCNGDDRTGYENVGTLRFHSSMESESLTIPEMIGLVKGIHCVGRFNGDVVDDVKVNCYDTPDHELDGVKLADKALGELLPKLLKGNLSPDEMGTLEDIIKSRLGTRRKLI